MEKFRPRWYVSHALGTLDRKNIAMKKYGSKYYNYKGLFSLVLLVLANAGYRFLWVDIGSSGSSSDAQIFHCSKLKEKTEDGTLGLSVPGPLGGGRILCLQVNKTLFLI